MIYPILRTCMDLALRRNPTKDGILGALLLYDNYLITSDFEEIKQYLIENSLDENTANEIYMELEQWLKKEASIKGGDKIMEDFEVGEEVGRALSHSNKADDVIRELQSAFDLIRDSDPKRIKEWLEAVRIELMEHVSSEMADEVIAGLRQREDRVDMFGNRLDKTPEETARDKQSSGQPETRPSAEPIK